MIQSLRPIVLMALAAVLCGIYIVVLELTVPPPTPAVAQNNPRPQKPNGYQQITSLGSAATLTIPAGSTYAVVCVETQAVRWRDDGVAPTASVGMPIPAGSCMQIVILAPTNLQFIQQTASATIDVNYYQ